MTEKFEVSIPHQNPLQVVCKPQLPKSLYNGSQLTPVEPFQVQHFSAE